MKRNESKDSRAKVTVFSSQAGLILGFAAMLVLMLLITVVGVNRMEDMQSHLDAYTHTDMYKIGIGAEMRAIARERTLILNRLLYLDDPFERDENEMQLYASASRFAESRRRLMAMPLTDTEKEILAIQGEQAKIAVPLLRRVVELSKEDRMEEARALFVHSSMPAQNELIDTMQKLYESQMHESHLTNQRVNVQFEKTRLWMYIIAISIFILGTFIATIVIRRNMALDKEKEKNLAVIRDTNKELKEYSSELLIARDAAQQSSKAKSQFLANMSHELRTPMNAIMGFSELLIDEASESGNEEMLRDLNRILVASQHLLSLINQILDLAKVEAGKTEVNIQGFEIQPVITEVLNTVEPLANKNNNVMEIELDPALSIMDSDQVMIRQILFNLLSNAVKFTENGVIRFSARIISDDTSKWLEMIVGDSGIGIDECQIERVFSAFEQVDGSFTRQFGGTGLGLALTKHYCDLLSGHIKVDSIPGQGTTFTVTVPLTHTQAVAV